MMTLIYTVISLIGICYLAHTNPKRRRTFGQPVLSKRKWVWPARFSVLVPGVLLILTADWSGLSIWAGVITVIGWIIAATSPVHMDRMRTVLKHGLLDVRQWIYGIWNGIGQNPDTTIGALISWIKRFFVGADDKACIIEELEARVDELEAELSDKNSANAPMKKTRTPTLKVVPSKTRS